MITSYPHRRSLVSGFAILAIVFCVVALVTACGTGGPSGHRAVTKPRGPSATGGATARPAPVATTEPGTPAAPGAPGAPGAPILPRCHTSQLAATFTGLNAAMGGQRGATLVLTNRSSRTCYVYGYVGLGFLDSSGVLPTHVTWISAPHTRVTLRPGGNAQTMVTWREYPDGTSTLVYPQWVQITPPDEYAHLIRPWPSSGAVRGGDVATWPLSAAPAGPVAIGTGTIQNPFNGMCMSVAGNGRTNGTRVAAWKCTGDSPQQWTAYNDGTLRINGKCLDIVGRSTKIGAKVDIWTCDGSPSQRWQIGQVSSDPFGPITNAGSGNALTDPGGSTINGTPLQMGPNRGDLSGPWHVSFHRYVRI
jgi:Protein of unknown function (DUF4232)/Ricin-type beta-trefoil lectin domain